MSNLEKLYIDVLLRDKTQDEIDKIRKNLVNSLSVQLGVTVNQDLLDRSVRDVLEGRTYKLNLLADSSQTVASLKKSISQSALNDYVKYNEQNKSSGSSIAGYVEDFNTLADTVSNTITMVELAGKAISKFGRGGLYGAAAVGLAGTIFAIYDEAEGLNNALHNIKEKEDLDADAEILSFSNLVGKLKDVRQGTKEYGDIIAQINMQYGRYLPQLLSEEDSYDRIKNSIDSVSSALKEKAEYQTFYKQKIAIDERHSKDIGEAYEKMQKRVRAVYGNEKAADITHEIALQINLNPEINVEEATRIAAEKAGKVYQTLDEMRSPEWKAELDPGKYLYNDATGYSLKIKQWGQANKELSDAFYANRPPLEVAPTLSKGWKDDLKGQIGDASDLKMILEASPDPLSFIENLRTVYEQAQNKIKDYKPLLTKWEITPEIINSPALFQGLPLFQQGAVKSVNDAQQTVDIATQLSGMFGMSLTGGKNTGSALPREDAYTRKLMKQLELLREAQAEYAKLSRIAGGEEAYAGMKQIARYSGFSAEELKKTGLESYLQQVYEKSKKSNSETAKNLRESIEKELAQIRLSNNPAYAQKLSEEIAGNIRENNAAAMENGIEKNYTQLLNRQMNETSEMDQQILRLKEEGASDKDLDSLKQSLIKKQSSELRQFFRESLGLHEEYSAGRLQIEKEFQSEMAVLDLARVDGDLSEEDYNTYVENATKKKKKAVSSLDLDEFKKSDEWNKVFGDEGSGDYSDIGNLLRKINGAKAEGGIFADADPETLKQLDESYKELEKMLSSDGELYNFILSYNKYMSAKREESLAASELGLLKQEKEDLESSGQDENSLEYQQEYEDVVNRIAEAEARVSAASRQRNSAMMELSGNMGVVIGYARSLSTSLRGLGNAISAGLGDEVGSVIDKMIGLADPIQEYIKASSALKDVNARLGTTTETVSDAADAGLDASKAANEAAKGMATANVILAIVTVALEIYNQITSIFSANDKEKQEYIEGIYELQLAYNKALWETKMLHDKVWGENKIGNVLQDINNLDEAMEKYYERLNVVEVRKKVIKKTEKNAGDTLNALKDTLKSDSSTMNTLASSLKENSNKKVEYEEIVITARENLKYKTQKGSKGFLGIGSKGTKTQNLEEWIRTNLGAELFDEQSRLNLSIAQELLSNHEDRLTDETKRTLEALVQYEEIMRELEEQISDYVSETFGKLGGQLSDSLIDAFRNGTDAAEAFGNAVGGVLEDIGQQLLQNMLVETVLNEYQDKITGIYKDYARSGDMDTFTTSIGQLMGTMGNDLQAFIPAGTEFLEQYKDTVRAATGQDIYQPSDSDSGTLAGSIRSSVTEDTAQLLASYINSIRADVAMQSTSLRQLAEEYAPQMNNTLALQLAELKRIELNTQATSQNTRQNAELTAEILSMLQSVTNGVRAFRVN